MPTVTLRTESGTTKGDFPVHTLLSDALAALGAPVTLPCGGIGRCGNCAVQVEGSLTPPDIQEQQLLRSRVLRLACKARLLGDCTVNLTDVGKLAVEIGMEPIPTDDISRQLGAAVDIGTTTVAIALYDLMQGVCVARHGVANPQSVFGSDVLSRVGACVEKPENIRRQQQLITDCILQGLTQCARSVGREPDHIRRIVVTGNCVMEHLFAGLDPSGLAKLPFAPSTLFRGGFDAQIPGFDFAEVCLFPCISGFVGGDTVAALLALGEDFRHQTALLADIGTNGEMVFSARGRLYACATAAGPAFEGAGIHAGVGAVPGAVCRVDSRNGLPLWETIGRQPPLGLCGSGLVDAIAFGLETEVIDETGRLLPPDEVSPCPAASLLTESESDGVTLTLAPGVDLTESDVRAYQLAKAAVAAGMAVLPLHADTSAQDVTQLYIAGGFGAALRCDKARKTGLIPAVFQAPVTCLGNAALKGAAKLLLHPELQAEAERLAEQTTFIDLSADPLFMEEYITQMTFA